MASFRLKMIANVAIAKSPAVICFKCVFYYMQYQNLDARGKLLERGQNI